MNLSTLEPGELACPACGQRVDNPREIEEFDSIEVEHVMNGGYIHTVRPDAPMVTQMSRCPVCRWTRERAQKIVDEHPAVLRPRGWEGHQLALVETALMALDAVGIMAYMADGMASNDKQLRLLIDHLSPVGGYAGFASNFVGVARAGFTNGAHGSGPGICAAGRWQHLSAETKAMLSSAYDELLLARTDSEIDVQPPEDGVRGCLLCGIDHITVLRSKSYNVWGPLYTLQPGYAGGADQPEDVAGYLCPEDRALVQQFGMGVTAMEHSLVDFLDAKLQMEPSIDWVPAWAAGRRTKPNLTRWAHVNLEMLKEQLERVKVGLAPMRLPVTHV